MDQLWGGGGSRISNPRKVGANFPEVLLALPLEPILLCMETLIGCLLLGAALLVLRGAWNVLSGGRQTPSRLQAAHDQLQRIRHAGTTEEVRAAGRELRKLGW